MADFLPACRRGLERIGCGVAGRSGWGEDHLRIVGVAGLGVYFRQRPARVAVRYFVSLGRVSEGRGAAVVGLLVECRAVIGVCVLGSRATLKRSRGVAASAVEVRTLIGPLRR